MVNEMRSYVLELVAAEFETGHQIADDFNTFKTAVAEDGFRATKDMYALYVECHEMGPASFEELYGDELDDNSDFVTEYDETIIEEIEELDEATNMQKLYKKYPELRNHIAINEDQQVPGQLSLFDSENIRKAVGVLYAMDDFVLSVYDNMYWLTMGVPDGEFDESSREAAEDNYEEHAWLISEDSLLNREDFAELVDAFEYATKNSRDYDQVERAKLVDEAYAIARLSESIEPTDDASSLQESVDDMDKRCETCNTLLNDMGECPKCVHGEEDLDEKLVHVDDKWEVRSEDGSKLLGTHDTKEEAEKQLQAIHASQHESLTEDALTEAPKLSRDDRAAAKAAKRDEKAQERAQKQAEKIIAIDHSNKSAKFYVTDGKGNVKKILNYDDFMREYKNNFEARCDAIVVSADGFLIRRGLQTYKPRAMRFNPKNKMMLTPDHKYTYAGITGAQAESELTGETETPDSAEIAPETPSTETEPEVAEPAAEEPAIAPVESVSKETLAYIFNSLKRAKKSISLSQLSGGRKIAIDPKDLKPDNIADVYINVNGTEMTLNDLISKYKDDARKRKEAAIRTAALFGESLDDDMRYEEYEDEELDEALNKDEYEELMQLAHEIGLKTGKDLVDFANREKLPHEDPLETIRRYRDTLGDDFEVIEESVEIDPMTEAFVDTDDLMNSVTNLEKRDALQMMLDRAARYFRVEPSELVVFSDSDLEFDPVYFADSSKELAPGLIKFGVADIEIIKAKAPGNDLLCFRNKADADSYVEAAQRGNI